MARPKKNAPVTPQDIEEIEEAKLDEAMEFATTTLTGDLRDAILDRLKFEQSKRPWHERSESDQRQAVHEIEVVARDLVTRAVEIIAGHGRKTIRATIDKVEFKDGIKAVLVAGKFDKHRHDLADAQGSSVLIVVADADEFTGEREPVEIKPDQAELLGEDAMAVHSQAHEAPFSVN